MVKLTRAQRVALKRVYDRTPLYLRAFRNAVTSQPYSVGQRAVSYRQFRKMVQIGYDNCAMVHWCGMWLGIERDGYTHS